MRIGFLTGSITQIGSGRAEAVPLARAFSKLGCVSYGLETTRFKRGRTNVEDLEVYLEPVAPYLAPRSLQLVHAFLRRSPFGGGTRLLNGVRPLERATGNALLNLAERLELDVVYAFHNTNVARILSGWPHPSRLLVINLIGFGIDPSRGGAADTFPLQQHIFAHPWWDLHVAATKFECDQYCWVYEQLGIHPRKLMHLPHSYDEDRFYPPAESFVRNRSVTDPKTILYPVNVYQRKNIELAIDVLTVINQHVDCNLIVTGTIWDSAYHARLVQYAHERSVGDSVTFLGGVPIETMVELYHQADVTIYTSHQETFGLGIVESLGCGTAVVGPDWIRPCREILDASPGGWAAPNDPYEFARAILSAFRAVPEPVQVAAAARTQYGNMAVATRFLERCIEIRAEKEAYGAKLESINWKGLYQDAGNLL